MAQEFGNEQIAKFFGKQIQGLAQKKDELSRAALEEHAQLQQRRNSFQEENKQVQENLDASIEQLEDRFTDLGNAVEYDAERLEKLFLS